MRSPDGRECSTFIRHRTIAISGRRTTTLYLLNPTEREVEQIVVDGCAITEGQRCDWLLRLSDDTSREELYVDLKGSGVFYAVEQLQTTIPQLSADSAKFPKRCVVVFTRNPTTGTDIQKFKVQFRKTFNASFLVVKDQSRIAL